MTTILPSRSEENFIVGPRDVVLKVRRSFGGEPLALKWGQRFSSVRRVNFRLGRGLRLYLSRQVLTDLGLTPGIRLHLGYNSAQRTLRLGPVVGILAYYHLGDPPLYGQGAFFRTFISLAKQKGVFAYVFAPDDVDWQAGVVHGLIPGRSLSGWLRGTFPLPDVVYNRIQNRSLEARADAQAAIGRFARMRGVTLFNRGFLDKWAVHTLLSKRPNLRRYVPRTERLRGASTFQSMFTYSNRLFVKPVDGSLGSDIAIVERRPDGTYAYNYYSVRGLIWGRHFVAPSALWKHLNAHLSKRPFIVQQEIRLATYRRRRFDLRVIVQRGRGGRWHVGTMYARVAAKGEYRTNVGVGAQTISWQRVLRGAFGRKAPAVMRALMRGVRAITIGFAEASPSHVAELAIDIGLDKQGVPWLIEMNSKPVRHVGNRYVPPSHIAPRSLTTLLDYSKTLAGF